MITLTADASMLAILSQATEPAEIRDASGNVIGFYAPAAIKDAQVYDNAAAHFDPSEIARRRASAERGRTTREVFEHLQSLTQDEEMRGRLQEKIDRLRERDQCGSP